MSKISIASRRSPLAATIIAAVAIGIAAPAAPVFADPPPWAPAHGYREKHKNKHKGKGRHRNRQVEAPASPEYVRLPENGIGECNRQALGAVIGAGVGAAAGSRIGSGSGRTAAVIAGTVIGGILGGVIGRSMDEADTQCIGQVLEHAPNGQAVEWKKPDGSLDYRIRPTLTYGTGEGRYCREYTVEANVGGALQQMYGKACRKPDGTWRLES